MKQIKTLLNWDLRITLAIWQFYRNEVLKC